MVAKESRYVAILMKMMIIYNNMKAQKYYPRTHIREKKERERIRERK